MWELFGARYDLSDFPVTMFLSKFNVGYLMYYLSKVGIPHFEHLAITRYFSEICVMVLTE